MIYIPLEKLDTFETSGWAIDFSQLFTTQDMAKIKWNYLFESLNNRYCCFMYNITEYRMDAYAGFIGVFENKKTPKIILNPKGVSFGFEYPGERTLTFEDSILFLRKEIHFSDNPNLSGVPFIAIDLVEKKFRFIDFDHSSYYYSPKKVEGVIFKLHLDLPKEIGNSERKYVSREGELFDLSKLPSYSLDKLNDDTFFQLYRKEKELLV